MRNMGTIYKTGKFVVRVNGFEHPPVHAHVMHPDGKAMVYLNGAIKNKGVPAAVMAEAQSWIFANTHTVITEWNICNPKA
jgi:hypothetical protein